MDGLSKGKIFLILFFILLSACLFFADTLFDKAVKKTVSLALHAINSKKELLVSIDEVDMDAAKGSLYLRGLKLIPDSLYFNKFKSGTAGKRMLSDIQISEIELTGLNIKNLFWNGRIDSAVISVKNIVTNIYLSKQSNEPTSTTNVQHSRLMDSIHLKGLKRLDLRGIEVDTFKINLLDASSSDTISSFSGDYMELDGIDFEQRQDGSHLFDLRTEKLEISLKNQYLKLDKNEHEIRLGALHFKNSEQSLELVDFSYHPIKSLEHLASRRTFADNLFAVSIKNLSLLGVNIDAFEENQLGSLRTILVDGMDIHILKNKQKPLNTRIRPLLPHQQLKSLNYPIHIGQIAILNSSLTYKEIQPKDAHDIMTVNLSDLNAEVNYITSIKDSLVSGKTLSIALRAKLMDKAEMDVSIAMPYNHRNDAFHFRGNIGPANLSIFNPLLMPSARIAVKKGKMESIQFSVNATPDHAEGELTMRYSDLHVDIPRRNKNVGHALSFLASSAIHSFNPKKNGRLRVAKVYYNRVPYKGAGNYMVKSVVSGVINSIQPLGKNQKQIKIKDKKNKSATKSQNKKVKRQKRAKSKAIRQ